MTFFGSLRILINQNQNKTGVQVTVRRKALKIALKSGGLPQGPQWALQTELKCSWCLLPERRCSAPLCKVVMTLTCPERESSAKMPIHPILIGCSHPPPGPSQVWQSTTVATLRVEIKSVFSFMLSAVWLFIFYKNSS